MKIAIHSADLDSERVDGTRVYMHNVLKWMGKISPTDNFHIYHKKNFNSQLAPPELENYSFSKKDFPISWTQTLFAWMIWKDAPDALWMPMHNLPLVRRRNLKTIVTIHDLAFKIFPEHFPKKDLHKLNLLTDYAVKNADKIIAVSQSTKNDILKFYPQITEEKIKVIYHGFDPEIFQKKISLEVSEKILGTYNLKPKTYLLYVGAIQPRKNLAVLIEAFEKIKQEKPELKLVLAGNKAWLWEGVVDKIKKSRFKKDIIITGNLPFSQMAVLFQQATVFVFPSLYEGFGIPLLEAFASAVPVIAGNNSSLIEVGADGALYFDVQNPTQLFEKIKQVLDDENLRKRLVEKGSARLKNFSWEKCARETLDFIKKTILAWKKSPDEE